MSAILSLAASLYSVAMLPSWKTVPEVDGLATMPGALPWPCERPSRAQQMRKGLRPFADWLLYLRRIAMNWDRVEGNWKQVKGAVKARWGKLTDDDFDVIAGKREQLAGKIQERYGIEKDEAERQLNEWERDQRD
jgi:uncharacterized protein YjbJ (UPF0337 family)